MLNMDKRVRLELTSSPFRGEEARAKFDACRAVAESYNLELGIQIHNTEPPERVKELLALNVPVSAHAPVTGDCILNLAAADFTPVARSIEAHRKLFAAAGIVKTVFHGFMMTDDPVANFGHGKSYDECMRPVYRPELSYAPETRLNRDFTCEPEFMERRERVKERLAWLAAAMPEVEWCIENDFPAYGSANMLAGDAAALQHSLCLDSSHLWATANLFDLDYYDQVGRFFDTGNVTMVHLHASKYDKSIPKLEWSDGHLPLRHPNRMDLPRFVRMGRTAGVRYWVLEVVKATEEDVRCFGEWWQMAGEKAK